MNIARNAKAALVTTMIMAAMMILADGNPSDHEEVGGCTKVIWRLFDQMSVHCRVDHSE